MKVVGTVRALLNKKPPRTHVCVLLDESGSMGPLHRETVSDFNEMVDSVRGSAVGDVNVSLVSFNDSSRQLLWNAPITKLTHINGSVYEPRGQTALYSALGATICDLEDLDDGVTSYLVNVITDGEENASTGEWASSEKLRDKIAQMVATGRWTFAFMCANYVDLGRLKKTLGLADGNMAEFHATKDGMYSATVTNVRALSRYMTARAAGENGTLDFYESK